MTTTYEPGTIKQLDPATLVLERNIREAKLDPEFVASIRELGVLEPITAVIGADGRLVVRFGQRRTIGALSAGRPTVPVYIAGDDDTTNDAEISRVISQRDENTHRASLTADEEVAVVEQLVAFGLSAEDVAAQARISQDRVTAASSVSASKLARKATAKYEALTLDQAAAVAEFDGDAETAKALIVCAVEDPTQFAHVLQRARDDRAEAIAIAATTKELEDAGVKVVQAPGYNSKTKATRLDYLVDEKRKELTSEGHQGCKGHVAWVSTRYQWKTVDGVERRLIEAYPTYGCTAPSKYGHKDRYGGGSSSSKPAAADLSDTEREKARAARRLVIDNNKAWDSAEVVRREWLAEFAKRKTPPKGAAAFIATALAGERMWLSDYRVPAIVVELLGAKSGTRLEAHVAGLLKGATENRAQVVALAQILAAIEATTSKQSWREDGTKSTCGRYLRFLESAGYGLSDVEKYALSSKSA
jgi:ParB-like chromosome segregation protein Spo0J